MNPFIICMNPFIIMASKYSHDSCTAVFNLQNIIKINFYLYNNLIDFYLYGDNAVDFLHI